MESKVIYIAIIVLGAVGFIFSFILALLSIKLKVEDDPRVTKIMDILPGVNCGACGFSGCHAFAEAVVAKNTLFSGCIPGGDEVNRKIAEIVGIDFSCRGGNKIAICHCHAGEGEKKFSARYYGPHTCAAANITGGGLDCSYGCFGLGDCARVCPVGAITIIKRRVVVDVNKCIGCGNCVRACPRGLFELVDVSHLKHFFYVGCSNLDKGKEVKSVCVSGCIACGICSRLAPDYFRIENNLSYALYTPDADEKKVLSAADKCPVKCIIPVDV